MELLRRLGSGKKRDRKAMRMGKRMMRKEEGMKEMREEERSDNFVGE